MDIEDQLNEVWQQILELDESGDAKYLCLAKLLEMATGEEPDKCEAAIMAAYKSIGHGPPE